MAVMKSVETILEGHPDAGRDHLIPILQEVQAVEGYLSKASIAQVGEQLHLPASKIFGVATFYNMFRFQPKGKYHVMVCRGTACHTRGSKARLEALKRLLNLKEEEGAEKIFLTTADKRFTIKTVACFGQCALAPVVEVDGKMQSHVTEVCLKELVNGLARGGKRK